jgi:CHAT domain-containing protein
MVSTAIAIGASNASGYPATGGKTEFAYAHPLFWAPYSIIGDGGGR